MNPEPILTLSERRSKLCIDFVEAADLLVLAGQRATDPLHIARTSVDLMIELQDYAKQRLMPGAPLDWVTDAAIAQAEVLLADALAATVKCPSSVHAEDDDRTAVESLIESLAVNGLADELPEMFADDLTLHRLAGAAYDSELAASAIACLEGGESVMDNVAPSLVLYTLLILCILHGAGEFIDAPAAGPSEEEAPADAAEATAAI